MVFAAAAIGTQKLLHKMKAQGHLPKLSDRLGYLSRTNSESILGAIAPDTSIDYSQGIAITSSFHPDEHTHVEPVRYGKGSNAMALMQTVLTDGDGPVPRWRTWLEELWLQRGSVLDLYDVKHWSERDGHRPGDADAGQLDHDVRQADPGHEEVAADLQAGPRRARTRPGSRWPTRWCGGWRRSWAARRAAPIGDPFNMPMTAHFIGGCTIGTSPEDGVVDAYQRVFNYPGLHIADGSAISANLGVNPSLTITAQAERAMSFWPNKGEEDPRPPLGSAYERVAPVPPAHPAVPPTAPAALRLPIVAVS